MTKTTLNLSPPLAATQREAETMGISFPALLTADLVRYRVLAEAAVPPLDAWQWDLLSHVLGGIEAHRIVSGDDSLPSGRRIAGELGQQVLAWPPLTVAGVLHRLRRVGAQRVLVGGVGT